MGIRTRVYQLDRDLAINIPAEVLPPGKIQLVKEWKEIPGFLGETDRWVPLLAGRRERSGRIALHIPYDVMDGFDIDPNKDVDIRLYGLPGVWYRSHIHHRFPNQMVKDRRIWIPGRIANQLKIREYEYYPVIMRGTTKPRWEEKLVEKEVRKVVIQHMDRNYETENYAPNRWRWRIPKTIESYSVLLQAFKMIPTIIPLAEVHRMGDIIYLDFAFHPDSGRLVSSKMNYAWRSMACRNYTAAATVNLGYPLLIEIRVSHISSTPKRFYQIKERAVYDKGALTLKQALETCVYNLLQYFFPSAKKEHKYSSVSYAEHQGTIEYTTEKVDLRRRYPRLRNVPRITSIGETSIEPWDIMEYPYYRAIKYIRIIGKWAYKNRDFTRHIYTDDDVERVLYQNEEKRLEMGLPRRLWIDDNGFVWRAD